MSIDSREPTRTSDLMPVLNAMVGRAAGLDERMERVRFGQREPISLVVRQMVHRRDGWRCVWCGASPWADRSKRRAEVLHLDHILPWSAGGSDRSDNLRTLCDKCNLYRSNYRADADTATAAPCTGICDPCRGTATDRPADAIEVFCGSRRHYGWVTDEARIL